MTSQKIIKIIWRSRSVQSTIFPSDEKTSGIIKRYECEILVHWCTVYGCVMFSLWPQRNTQKHTAQNQRHILKLTPVRCFLITASLTKKAKWIKHFFPKKCFKFHSRNKQKQKKKHRREASDSFLATNEQNSSVLVPAVSSTRLPFGSVKRVHEFATLSSWYDILTSQRLPEANSSEWRAVSWRYMMSAHLA